jgi:hypothetical protein
LAQHVTQHAENDFQKAVMISDFLRSFFEYTFTPGNTPPEHDFVDWFLFDIQTGYCTYFASAFVTMMRALGVPARYVEGFAVPNGHGYLNVINRQGHAWGEVYFEGFGWHLFEPTPPDAMFSWEEQSSPQAAPVWRGGTGEDIQFNPAEDWDGWTGPETTDDAPTADAAETPEDPVVAAAAPTDANAFRLEGLNRLFTLILLTIGGLGLFLMVLRAILVVFKNKRLRRGSNNAATMAYFAKILKYMPHFNFRIDEDMTPLEFALTIDWTLGFDNSKVFMTDIVHIFYQAKYGGRPVTCEERAVVERALDTLDGRLKRYIGKRRYYTLKYLQAVL